MRVRASFSGRVQGVGFRATTRGIALGYRVSGWVRNEPDGTVTAEVQGAADEVDRFLADVGRQLSRSITTTERFEIPEVANSEGGAFVIQR